MRVIAEIKDIRGRLVRELFESKAVLELLLEKGIFSEEEYHGKVEKVKEEAIRKNPGLDTSWL